VHSYLPATAVSLCCLMPLNATWSAPPAASPPALPARAPASPAPAAASAMSSDGFAAEAAARHAKRTACLKEAKSKKLVGANRNAYVKDCMA